MKERLRLSYVLTRCVVFALAVAVPFIASAEPTTEEWVARYNGPGNKTDFSTSIAIDESGNAYVTGLSEASGSGPGYATLKYDTNGNQLWVARYDGPGNLYDGANTIAVDTSGNVYVTGMSDGIGTGWDYATVKYDTDGNQLWVARYNGPGNDYDVANAIAFDTSGNVYVTGVSDGNGTGLCYDEIRHRW